MTIHIGKSFILLIPLLVCSIYANEFSCGDLDTAACKTKFAKQFGDDFKVLHLDALRTLLTSYVNVANTIIGELPENDRFRALLQEGVTKTNKNLEDLNANADDVEKITTIMGKAMDDMGLDQSTSDLVSTDFIKVAEKHHFKEALTTPIHNAYRDTGKLWVKQYAGLRPEDIQAYPEYSKVNALMVKLADADNDPEKMVHFTNAANILNEDFHIDYFDSVTDIV